MLWKDLDLDYLKPQYLSINFKFLNYFNVNTVKKQELLHLY